MNRKEVERYITEQYGAEAEYPWEQYPEYAVFRHSSNRKWFAVTMRISADKLSIPGKIMVDILNVKCNTSVIASLLEEEPGFYPAYHMNKKNWISILLDDSVSAQKISWMVDKSYELTAIKSKKKQK